MKRLERMWSIGSIILHKNKINRGINESDDASIVAGMDSLLKIKIESSIERIDLELPMYKVEAFTITDCDDVRVFRLEYIYGDLGEIRRTLLIKVYDDSDADIIMYERKEGNSNNWLMKFFTGSLDGVNLSIAAS